MTTLLTAPSPPILLRGISWTTYQTLIQELETEPAQRLTYNQGILEIMVSSPPHEQYKRRLGRLVEVTTEETNTEIASFGSVTWSREDLQKGVEADECYYIQNEASIRAKPKIDLTTDPPPDLVIEIDITHSSLSRLDIYAALGIPEVWHYNGEDLTLYRLQQGHYSP